MLSRHRSRFFIVAAAIIVLLGITYGFVPGVPVYAATFTVDKPGDDTTMGTLRWAVQQANSTGGADVIDITYAGTITLNSTLPITEAVSIQGTGISTIITAPAAAPAFDLGAALTLNSVRLTGGAGGGYGIDATDFGSSVSMTDVYMDELAEYAINATSGAVSLTDVTITNSTSANGVIYIGNTASLTGAERLKITDSTAGTNRGVITIDTSAGGMTPFTRSIFSSNTGSAHVAVLSGSTTFTNSTFLDGNSGTGGILVGTNGTASLSFVTIAGNNSTGINAGGTVNAKNIINTDGCNGSAINLKGRNVLNAGCAFNDAGGAVVIPDNLLNLSPAGGPPEEYRLSNLSPAIDRADDCLTYDGIGVTEDVTGRPRPSRDTCDLGASEYTGTAIVGQISVTGQPAYVHEDPLNPQNIGDVTLQLNTYNFSAIDVSITNANPVKECLVMDAGGVLTDPLTLTFAANEWNTDKLFKVQGNQDIEPEGDHTCTLTVSVSTNSDGVTDRAYERSTPANNYTFDLVINVRDDDLTDKPNLDINYGNLLTATLIETDPNAPGAKPSESVTVKLDAPPSAPVSVWMESAKLAVERQCEMSADAAAPLTLTTANWSTGVTINVEALDDGRYETTAKQCSIYVRAKYSFDNDETVETAQTVNVDVDPDMLLGVDPPGSPTIAEGEELLYELTLLPTASAKATNPENFTLRITSLSPLEGTLDDCQLSDGRNGNPTGEGTEFVFTQVDGDNVFLMGVLAIEDDPMGQIGEENQGCEIVVDILSPIPAKTPIPALQRTITINIENDPAPPSEANVIITNRDSGEIIYENGALKPPITSPISLTMVEGTGSPVRLGFSLDREVAGTVNINLVETAFSPVVPGIFDSQCVITSGSGASGSNVTVPLSGTNEIEVTLAPVDDKWLEDLDYPIHNCTLEISREDKAGTMLTYQITITDFTDDLFKAYTIPEMPDSPRVSVQENSSIDIIYIITTALSSQSTLYFDNKTPDICSLPGSMAIIPAGTNNLGGIFRVTTKAVAKDELCTFVVYMNPIPQNYRDDGGITNGDTFIPDIKLSVQNAFSDPGPTNTPDSSDPTPTTLGGDLTGVPTQSTEAFEGTPIPTAIPVPSVALAEGVDVLPVRTGPYLGATFVTIAVREDVTGVPQVYRVLARNNDENEDVTWFRIVANGKIGWASGRSLELRNVTEEELPFAGSIFDSIDNAPDLGVYGTVIKGRAVYRRPSTRAAVTGQYIPEGAVVSIIGRSREFPYDDWYQVRYGGGTGWILSEIRMEEPAVEVNPDQVRELVPVR